MLNIGRQAGKDSIPGLLRLRELSGMAHYGILRVKNSIENTAEWEVQAENLSAEQDSDLLTLLERKQVDPQKAYDVFQVESFCMEEGGNIGVLHAFLSLVRESPRMSLTGYIFNTETGAVLCRLPELVKIRSQHCELSEHFQMESGLDFGATALAIEACWQGETGDHRLVKVVDMTVSGRNMTYSHKNPVKKKSQADEPVIIGKEPEDKPTTHGLAEDPKHIVLCFLRYPSEYGDVDYMVNFGRYRKNDNPLFGLPGSGVVYLESGAEFVEEGSSGTCMIEPYSGGACLGACTGEIAIVKDADWMKESFEWKAPNGHVYQTSLGDIKLEGEGNYVTYSMMSAWNNGAMRFDDQGYFHSNYYHYTLRLCLQFRIDGVVRPFHLLVTSKSGTSPASADVVEIIKPLRLMFGCLEKGTRVRLTDGEKAVEEIRTGDILLGTDQKPTAVLDTWSGSELRELVQITAESGEVIRVTCGHPMVTENGYCAAGRLSGEELLRMADGALRRVKVERVSYTGEVYNITTKDGRPFLAQGFVTGDMQAQNHIEGQAFNPISGSRE